MRLEFFQSLLRDISWDPLDLPVGGSGYCALPGESLSALTLTPLPPGEGNVKERDFVKLPDGVLEVTRHGESNPCPDCGSRSVAEMLFGLPIPSEDLKRRKRRGEVTLAGCVAFPVRWYCNACGRAWGDGTDPGR